MSDLTRRVAQKFLEKKLNNVASESRVKNALLRAYDQEASMDDLLSEATKIASGEGVYARLSNPKQHLLKVLNSLLRDHQIKDSAIALPKEETSKLRSFINRL